MRLNPPLPQNNNHPLFLLLSSPSALVLPFPIRFLHPSHYHFWALIVAHRPPPLKIPEDCPSKSEKWRQVRKDEEEEGRKGGRSCAILCAKAMIGRADCATGRPCPQLPKLSLKVVPTFPVPATLRLRQSWHPSPFHLHLHQIPGIPLRLPTSKTQHC